MNKNKKGDTFINFTDDKVKLIIMLSIIGIVLIFVIINNRNLPEGYNPLNGTPFDPNRNKEVTSNEGYDKFSTYLEIINSLISNSYENTYTIEPDDEDEYFFLRGSIDNDKELYYKEYKDKYEVLLKSGNSYYIVGKNVLKKTRKKLDYEGYDTTLFNVSNLYTLLSNKEDYEIIKEDGIIKTRVKVDLNELIKLYNKTNEEIETKKEDKMIYLTIDIYEEDSKLILTTDLKDFYEYVYGKNYNYIIYDLEFYNIGTTSLSDIENELTSID